MRVDVRFADLLAIYRAELLERVVPFWLEHALDQRHGGILTCISDQGDVLSTDKYMWSQLRALWTFSALYNRIEPRAEWIEAARQIYAFIEAHGRDAEGRWVFAVDQNGQVLEGATSIYADGFAIYGLTEYARATNDRAAIELALESYANVQARLAEPGSYATAPYPLPPGTKSHGVAMIFSLTFHELGLLLNDETILTAGLRLAEDILDNFVQPDQQLLLEYIHLDNTTIDSPQGRAIVPGHAIESMWFLIHIFQHWQHESRIRQAVEVIRWHMELGWDQDFGGILLATDAAGDAPWWPFAESKLWWPQTEALYALLLAYEQAGESWTLDWYARVHDYAFRHYPVPHYGEWTQKLDRQGNPFTQTVALPVKDPFHLPRALIHAIEVLGRLSQHTHESDDHASA